jgi:1-deoxy-D-xylulose-5-phosphate reductoisomerase
MSIVPLHTSHGSQSNAPQRKIALFGSTGSIGTSTVEILKRFPERFEVACLVGGANRSLLLEQIALLQPAVVVAALPAHVDGLSDDEFVAQAIKLHPSLEVRFGQDGVREAARFVDYDIMVAGIVGIAGLDSVYEAVVRGKQIALANKESMVCAGEMLTTLAKQTGASFLPVDSEHSALWQALQGNHRDDVKRFILTASGGPFLHTPLSDLTSITPAQALKHPKWTMGAKVTIDSSTLFNKCLELIEAYWLFGARREELSVVIHPESIVHSSIEYRDGTHMFQCSVPDMKGAIGYALSYPAGRLDSLMEPLSLAALGALHFFDVDTKKFPAITFADRVLAGSSGDSVVLNAADELAVSRFLRGELAWTKIPTFIEDVLERFGGQNVHTIDDVAALNNRVKYEVL